MWRKLLSPGSLNASFETKEKIRVKATQLFMVKDQEDMKLQLSVSVLLYGDRKHEKNTTVAHLDSCVGVTCADTRLTILDGFPF